jgi:MYXO-CTERM domain-containing protein
MRFARRLGATIGVSLVGVLSLVGERDAAACGGCITPPPPPSVTETESVITDEQMIFSISQDQTTLYDEIQYSGSPSSFAWVLPIKGTVTVGLSADILFQTIQVLTATTVTSPATGCPPPPTCNSGGGGACGSSTFAAGGFAAAAPDAGSHAVTVTSQKQVGPYETVQLHSNDGSALSDWLKKNGYVVAAADAPVIAAYVTQGFDFLALKLVPGEGVQAMQPVRVTSKGAAISLPLHMVAVGTGATTGITIYVVADGRWEPQNFPTFTISDSELVWDWTTSSSNYESLRLSKEAALGGRGWQIESSLELNQASIANSLEDNISGDTNSVGGYSYAGPSDAGTESEASAGEEGGSLGYGGGPDSTAASADLAVLFAGIKSPNVRITRMRSDVAHAALSEDMALQAAKDQGELTNQHIPEKQTGEPQCPVYDDNCLQTGTAPRDQALASQNGGCNTKRPDSSGTLAILMGLLGLGAIRFHRRRKEAR